MEELQANTEIKVRIGPFVDVGDGFTPQTDIGNPDTDLTGVDEAELLKHNGAGTVDLTSNVWVAITGCDGWYDLTLTTTDTNTEGLLTVVIQDDSDCLPVHRHFMVLAQAAWISKYTAKDSGYMDVDIKAIAGTATPNTSGKLHVLNGDGAAITAAGPTNTQLNTAIALCAQVADGWDAALATILDNFSATRIGYLDELDFGLTEALSAISAYVDCLPAALGDIVTKTEASVVDAVWDEALTGATHNIATSAGRRLRQAGVDAALIREDTCQGGGTASNVILDTGASGTNNYYDHMWIYLTAGTGAGQVRTIHAYVGNTFTGDVYPDWLTTPDATSEYAIISLGSSHVHELENLALGQINAEVDGALNTAVPGSPTAHSINQRIKAIDELTEASGDGDLASVKGTAEAIPTTAMRGTDDAATEAKQDIIDTNVDKVITAMELDGAVYRFTENALEEGPSGTGGDATEAKQDTIITALGVVQADLDDPDQYKAPGQVRT